MYDEALMEGERSIKKGLGIPQALLPYTIRLRILLKEAQQLTQQFGNDVSISAAKIASEILDDNSSIYGLTRFLASRTPAERVRLKTYLTEETDISFTEKSSTAPICSWKKGSLGHSPPRPPSSLYSGQ